MRVEDYMVTEVRACDSDTSLAVAAAKMWEYDCGVLPVVDELGCVIGVITDRDICIAVGTRHRVAADISIGEVMSRSVAVCHPGDHIKTAMRTMQEQRVRRLPVVDDRGLLVGILSLDELAMSAEWGRDAALPAADVLLTFRVVCGQRFLQTTAGTAM